MSADTKEQEEAIRRRREEDVRRLRNFPAFEKFSDGDLKRLVSAAHHSSQSVPWPLIREQTPSDACFILLSGEAGVYVGDARIAVVGPGEVIGESALRRGQLRSATVTTIGPAEFLRIERNDLARLLDEIPALRETMDSTAARHTPVTPTPKPKPERSKLNASVPTDLVERFEQAANDAGVSAGAALEEALSQWLEKKGSS
ncbi:cAMP-binding protein [Mycobacterium intermedium]|uniref:cAMP-binding protein n=1 Tax=Mycobacterium intermedium TaxID=28445 RepID=A0A1E3SIL6_MYCIE|nr:cyclic nucleotide-binding domain-containing protein [Mycobacterium intermedium]MCV6967187.1 cyclic nucleotide-binding domain-containing protein [Mycobacterium intermedium]ODR02014.1 cAMP-binding protein [Mycobacterium intermedium]OPE51295.1 cAMP-binding protein [Mycobacterium intermedium]ORB05790.1 cAMP-binding protein [Mycobacterium intermedium]